MKHLASLFLIITFVMPVSTTTPHAYNWHLPDKERIITLSGFVAFTGMFILISYFGKTNHSSSLENDSINDEQYNTYQPIWQKEEVIQSNQKENSQIENHETAPTTNNDEIDKQEQRDDEKLIKFIRKFELFESGF